jgi:hypothetical protein
MPLYAETIVEEWLNRQGFFTIRGIKLGLEEMDILAIKNTEHNTWKCIHCEVQVSIRPVGYISKVTKDLLIDLGVNTTTNAKQRTNDQLYHCAAQWVEKKFKTEKKAKVRRELVEGGNWSFMLVHGNVKDKRELELIEKCGVELIPIENIIHHLCNNKEVVATTSPASDIIELFNYYNIKTTQ